MDAKRLELSKAELAGLHVSSPRFWGAVIVLWLWIAAVVAGLHAVLDEPLGVRLAAGAIAFVVIGWLQYALVQAMHESVHQHFKRRTGVLAALATTWPVGLTRAYAAVHLAHHRYAGEPGRDPDHVLYGRFPRSRLELLGQTASYFCGLPAIVQRLMQRSSVPAARQGSRVELVGLVATQAALFAGFALAVHPLAYFVLWIGPIVTLVKGLGYLRILAEHADPVEPVMFRSFDTSFVAGNLLGPFGFCHHAEHHLLMGVPYSRLPVVHAKRAALAPDAFGARFVIHRGSHVGLLWQWFRSLPWSAR